VLRLGLETPRNTAEKIKRKCCYDLFRSNLSILTTNIEELLRVFVSKHFTDIDVQRVITSRILSYSLVNYTVCISSSMLLENIYGFYKVVNYDAQRY
jgi:cell division ATPase FtsA